MAAEPTAPEIIQDFFGKRQRLVSAALIGAVGFLIYSNTFGVPFVYDDFPLIRENPGITSLGFQQFETSLGSTRQIGFFTFFLNYWHSGFNVAGFHALNLLIHLANAMLVYLLVLSTFETSFFRQRLEKPLPKITTGLLALFSGLLFVSHPVQTQAVTYISQRFASLATLFYLASLLMYIKWRSLSNDGNGGPGDGSDGNGGPGDGSRAHGSRRILFYAAAIVFAVLAMRTKEISFTIPAAILLYEFTFFTGKIKRRIVNLLPIAATMLVIPLSLLGSSGAIGGDSVLAIRGITEGISSNDYFLTQVRVIVTYLRLFFFPVSQNLDYDYPLYQSFTNANVFLSFILLAALFGAGVYLFRRSGKKDPMLRLTAFGIFWFFITLSVESSINPITNLIDEHRMYLPSVGLIIALVATVYAASERLKKQFPRINSLIIPVSFLVIVVFAVSAFARNAVWRDPVSLWQDTVAKSPNKARPHTNLGVSYKEIGKLDKAQTEFELALKVDPDFEPEKAYYNLGVNYLRLGDTDRAIGELRKALEIKPDFIEARSNLGAAFMMLRQYDKAAAELEEAVKLYPDFAEARYNLGICYQMLGQDGKAAAEFEKVIQINPGFTQARKKLEEIYQAQGQSYRTP